MVLKSAAHHQSNTKYYRNLSLTQTERLTLECTTMFIWSQCRSSPPGTRTSEQNYRDTLSAPPHWLF